MSNILDLAIVLAGYGVLRNSGPELKWTCSSIKPSVCVLSISLLFLVRQLVNSDRIVADTLSLICEAVITLLHMSNAASQNTSIVSVVHAARCASISLKALFRLTPLAFILGTAIHGYAAWSIQTDIEKAKIVDYVADRLHLQPILRVLGPAKENTKPSVE
ncbi:hypothetical protein IWW48_002369 [Coemansia sp. RSA 1200]|nr:hypothetical protein IWW48_002369 [Coemansia sp. RSA 1200]